MRSRTATASRSGSTSSLALVVVALATFSWVGRAEAWPKWEAVEGHLSAGYGQLTESGAPGGSFVFAGGVDAPIREGLRVGIDLGFDLLGGQVVERGSLSADVEYSLLEVLALVHWTPPRGPWRVSVGPGLFHPRAAISSAGPAGFEDLAVDESAPGVAFGVELLSRREALVRAGIDVGVRSVVMTDDTWTVVHGRLTVHY